MLRATPSCSGLVLGVLVLLRVPVLPRASVLLGVLVLRSNLFFQLEVNLEELRSKQNCEYSKSCA